MHGLTQIERNNVRRRKKEDKDLDIVPCDVEKCFYFFRGGEVPFSALYRDEWMRCQHCIHHTRQDLSSF